MILNIVFTKSISVDPDKMPRYEAFHQDLHCLQRYLLRGIQYTRSYKRKHIWIEKCCDKMLTPSMTLASKSDTRTKAVNDVSPAVEPPCNNIYPYYFSQIHGRSYTSHHFI